jgi:filamentous hemagglutinin family protein
MRSRLPVVKIASAAGNSLQSARRLDITNAAVSRLHLIALLTLFAHPLFGGVVLDGSFGTQGSLPGPNFMIQSSFGKQVGSNLFQSFSQFNLTNTQSATFLGPNNVHNILARVTNGSPSSIDGTVNSSIPGANLFFLNPAGVLFGAHAQVNVTGSFAVSTANYLRLADGGKFNTSLGGGDVLTSAPVSAFGFLNSATASVSMNGSNSARDSRGHIIPGPGLNIQPQKSFSIVAGDIRMNASTISGPGSRLNLVSVKSPGEVQLDATNINSTIDLNYFTELGTIDLRNLSLVDTSGPGGGPIFIRGANINISNSQISSETFGSFDGSILDIALTRHVKLTDGGAIIADTAGGGRGSNITLTADSLFIKGLAMLHAPFTGIATASTTGATGNAGDLTITIGHQISFLGGGVIGATTFSSGDGGNITIRAGSLYMNSLADIAGNLTGILDRSERGATGDAGDVTITVDHALSIVSGSEISTATFAGGQGGDVTIHAGSLLIDNSLTDGGPTTLPTVNGPVNLLTGISAAATSGTGDAGNINLTVTGPMRMLGHGQIFDGALRNSTGTGGDITIHAGSLSIDDTGTDVTLVNPTRRVDISAETRGIGNAGNINIDVDGQLSIIGTGEIAVSTISLRSDTPVGPPRSIASGDAGDLTIHAGSLLIEGFATPSRATVDPKNVTGIAAIAKADGTDKNSGTTDTTGNAGNLTIDVDRWIKILGGGQINSSTFSNGEAGNITIRAGSLYMNSLGDIPLNLTGILNRSESGATGDAGDVMITLDHALSIVSGSEISAATFTSGQGGDLIIHAGSLLIDSTAAPDLFTGISAATQFAGGKATGNAGDLTISIDGALSIVGGNGSNVTAHIFAGTRGAGNGGTLTINAGSLSIDGTGLPHAGISTGTVGSGDAGNLSITVDGAVTLANSGQISSDTSFVAAVGSSGTGNAGSVSVQAHDLAVSGGEISTNAGRGTSGKAGSVKVKTRGDLTITEGGAISSSTSGKGDGGSVNMTADSLSIDGLATPEFNTGVFVSSDRRATGDAGNLTIRVDKLLSMVGVRSQISADTFSSGDGGSITIHAGSLSIDGLGSPTADAGIFVASFGTGDAGDLTITVDKLLSIVGRGLISAATYSGKGGDVTIYARSLSVDGSATAPDRGTGITADTQGSGDAGNISVQTRNLTLTGGGEIGSGTSSAGNGGSVTVKADSLSIDNAGAPPGLDSGIFAGAGENSTGNAGTVSVQAGNLTITNDGEISSGTGGAGNGGDVNVTANSLLIDGAGAAVFGTGIFASTGFNNTGDAGTVSVQARSLTLNGGGQISAHTFGAGKGGSVTVATDLLLIDGAGAASGFGTGFFATAEEGSTGDAGSVSVRARSVTLTNGGEISSASFTSGDAGSVFLRTVGPLKLKHGATISTSSETTDAGSIDITSGGKIKLKDQSSITVSAGHNGGDINITAPDLVYLLNRSITATAGANGLNGAGGNITIDPTFIVLNNSFVSANAAAGQGGNIKLISDFFFNSDLSNGNITATGTTNGTVNITAPALDLGAQLITLPSSLLSAANQLQERCTALLQEDFSSFISIGRGGTEPAPDELQEEF